MNHAEKIEKLANAPLREVIFEVHWEAAVDETTNQLFDSGFDLAQGLFADSLKNEFPVNNRLVPPLIFGFKVNTIVHQFWKSQNEWPVIQLGPGIMSVNDIGKSYVWSGSFKPLVERMLDILIGSYKQQLKFNQVSLKYIDAVDLVLADGRTVLNFIEERFKFKYHKDYFIEGRLNDIDISEAYLLNDNSKLVIKIANAVDGRRNIPLLMWQTAVTREASLNLKDIKEWLESAHSVASQLFKTMVNGKFYESFK